MGCKSCGSGGRGELFNVSHNSQTSKGVDVEEPKVKKTNGVKNRCGVISCCSRETGLVSEFEKA